MPTSKVAWNQGRKHEKNKPDMKQLQSTLDSDLAEILLRCLQGTVAWVKNDWLRENEAESDDQHYFRFLQGKYRFVRFTAKSVIRKMGMEERKWEGNKMAKEYAEKAHQIKGKSKVVCLRKDEL